MGSFFEFLSQKNRSPQYLRRSYESINFINFILFSFFFHFLFVSYLQFSVAIEADYELFSRYK